MNRIHTMMLDGILNALMALNSLGDLVVHYEFEIINEFERPDVKKIFRTVWFIATRILV